MLDTLALETPREQEAWDSTKRQRSAPKQEAKPENRLSAGSKAQSDVSPTFIPAGAEGNSGRLSVIGAWNIGP